MVPEDEMRTLCVAWTDTVLAAYAGLVAKHRATARRFRHIHPRVSRIHDRIADGYESQARGEGREAELTRRGLDR